MTWWTWERQMWTSLFCEGYVPAQDVTERNDGLARLRLRCSSCTRMRRMMMMATTFPMFRIRRLCLWWLYSSWYACSRSICELVVCQIDPACRGYVSDRYWVFSRFHGWFVPAEERRRVEGEGGEERGFVQGVGSRKKRNLPLTWPKRVERPTQAHDNTRSRFVIEETASHLVNLELKVQPKAQN